MAYTTLVAGTTITASWANASVRDQVVSPFASSSARTSAITVPVDGMVSTLTDSDSMWQYTGAAWIPANTLYVRKTGDETVTSNTTVQNDDHLVLAVAANRTYEVSGSIMYADGAGSGRLKAGFTAPASATFDWLADGLIDTDTTASAASIWRITNTISDTRNCGTGTTETDVMRIYGLLITSASSGNLQFQWAQVASDGTATTVKTGSWLLARPVA